MADATHEPMPYRHAATSVDGSRFENTYGFEFDAFQRRACDALAGGSSVLVAAPTGAGKTVVGEFAAWLALQTASKTFYTTPIKALSNQKFGDFSALHGAANTGLLTGDNSINGDAPIVVMTTEVLRNMIYEHSPTLDGLRYVVLDEVHYLQNPYRGAVWEEVLIHLPVEVQTISLSATVSNAEEFAEWLQTLRGRVEVIIEETRPVELRHWYLAGGELLPMFVAGDDGEPRPNPRGRELDRRRRHSSRRTQRGGHRPRERRPRPPLRSEVIDILDGEAMLPAIYFIFSRKGCDAAVEQCLRDNVRLTTDEERARIVEYADLRVTDIPGEELDLLGYARWREGLSRGVAAHHAGMIPAFKETVEELFTRGLIKVVFATETLALGINMPARTVVVESLMKFTGEKHEMMTPGEYTQLAGRAGRRGIDRLGNSVVLIQKFIDFEEITRLASTRTYPLVSSFQPSYNMAVNLVRTYDRDEAEHLVNSSFGQFQIDRDVVKMEQTLERLEAYLASYRERMACDRGDFTEYRDMRARLGELQATERRGRERSRATGIAEAIASLRPGDVFVVGGGRRRGRYVVAEVTGDGSGRGPRLVAVSESRSTVRFTVSDFKEPPRAATAIPLPTGFDLRDARGRRRLAQRLASIELPRRTQPPGRDEAQRSRALQRAVEKHPVHGCPDVGRHLHYADRALRLSKEIASLNKRIGRRSGTLARRFERVLEILVELGYVEGWTLTDKGQTLTRVYNEADLLVVEAIDSGMLEPLSAPELAAVLSTLVYETRGPEAMPVTRFPSRRSHDVFKRLLRLWRDIRKQEEARGLDLTREPDPGFAERAFFWADGAPLDEVLGYEDAAGDFVRSMKQLLDLMRQVEEIAVQPDLVRTVRAAREAVNRGVVSYTSVEP